MAKATNTHTHTHMLYNRTLTAFALQQWLHGRASMLLIRTLPVCCNLTFLPFGAGIIFLVLAHPVYKMLIIQEPNTLEL